jgi:hypothetical protein
MTPKKWLRFALFAMAVPVAFCVFLFVSVLIYVLVTDKPRQSATPVSQKSPVAKKESAPIANKKPFQFSEAPQPTGVKVNPFELLTFSASTNAYSTTVEGKVKNRTGNKYRYVSITFLLYSKSGERLGTATANVLDLEPQSTWKFKAVGLTPSARVKFHEIKGM